MNIHPENIIVNSCEYTPVYLIPNPGVTQGGSYFLASSAQDAQTQKPVSDNLKRFYENSGNLDSTSHSSTKPRILKKTSTNVVGNNLKLASFLLPKSEPPLPQCTIQSSVNVNVNVPQKAILTPVTNVVLKPSVTTVNSSKPVESSTGDANNSANTLPTPPIMEIDRKIVRVGTIPTTTAKFIFPKVPPKILPKEPLPPPPLPPNSMSTASNTTSVQLIKLGQTYHSLNQLSEEQMRIVNKALKIFGSGPEKPKEPAYDPDTNTKFIYKVVSAKDLTVPGRSKVVPKKRPDARKHTARKVERKEVKQELKTDESEEFLAEPKVTRSGRTVKLSRHIRRAESPQKPKKKVTPNPVHCFQCSNEFASLYRLQRHYENFPTHIPERVHSNLFHCLQAILKGLPKDKQAHMFMQQLEQLIEKLRSLLPCLLKKMDGCEGSPCSVNDEIGRLFGMLPGKYSLNMEALNCVKDTEGHCVHNPPPPKVPTLSSASRLRAEAEEAPDSEAESEDCARINSVDKWPTISKRILNKKKAETENFNAKRIRLTSESGEAIELSIDDVVTLVDPVLEQNIQVEQITSQEPKEQIALKVSSPDEIKETLSDGKETQNVHNLTESTSADQSVLTGPVKFFSTHFDIRSSPIKLPSALAKKFQLKPDEASSYEVQILRPLNLENDLDKNQSNIDSYNNTEVQDDSLSNASFSLDQMFPDNEIPKEILNELNDLSFQGNIFDSPLTKALKEANNFDHSLLQDKQILFDSSLMDVTPDTNMMEPTLLLKDKVDGYFEPAAIHVKTEKPNGTMKSALSHVKERSKILFEVRSMSEKPNAVDRLSQKSHSMFDASNHQSALFEPSNAIHSKDTLTRSRSLPKSNGIFESGIKHSKDDTLISSSMIDDKSNDMINSEPTMLHEKPSINDTSLDKSLVDLTHSDYTNDVRLLNNQGQSMLNFLDCLAYPETEIRNNTEDFQLDLFSFSSS